MLKKIKKELYFFRRNVLIESGLRNKRIVPFDGAFYEQLNQTIINGLPVSIYIRYL